MQLFVCKFDTPAPIALRNTWMTSHMITALNVIAKLVWNN